MRFDEIKSYAKVNIHLSTLGIYSSNYHKVESLICFTNLHDEIKVNQNNKSVHVVKFYGKYGKQVPSQNTVTCLLKLIDKKQLFRGKTFEIKIKKNIPLQSGMGGGSMNAASLIRYFLKKKILKLNTKEINKLCFKIGSDVILGLDNKLKIIKGKKKIIKLKRKIRLYMIFVKPNFGCNTSKIYKMNKKYSKPILTNNKLIKFKNLLSLKNDLEQPAFKSYPELKKIKEYLYKMPNIKFARMTGSGSTIVGYFSTKKHSLTALKIIKKKYKNYWCICAKTI